jgi:hypothetical protein
MGLASASCVYSPPPLLSYAQTADTLGRGRGSVGVEVGVGTAGSWWNAGNLGDPEITTKAVGASRLRLGIGDHWDMGVVGAAGPQGAYVAGPELKWRFAHLAETETEGAPSFNAAWISGFAVGSALYPHEYTPAPRHFFLAPYTGLLASGGIRVVQMFVGLRLAASETLGNHEMDLTLYPVLAFGVQFRPTHLLTFVAESDLAGGFTTHDMRDSAIIGFLSIGASVAFDELWGDHPAVPLR